MYTPEIDFAQSMDKEDELASLKNEFFFPERNGKQTIYFCGNSLGLQPKKCEQFMQEDLNAWRTLGVDGHFSGHRPWMDYHKQFTQPLADIVGAKTTEVVAMNNLTVNIHMLLASFYQPKGKRTKIMIESQAFSSDIYAVHSFVEHMGLDARENVIMLEPTNGELYETAAICETIHSYADEIALVFLGGLNYYTGQVLDMKQITQAGHGAGAKVGFDLAHAAGNIILELHDWKVDFAAWCSYKYMNGGPGAVSGIYIHERYATDENYPRLAGWWGQKESTRFQMQKNFDPTPTAEGWMVSNAGIFNMVNLLASLTLFQEAGMKRLRKKSEKLTGYLEYLILNLDPRQQYIKLITPSAKEERGCQLSMYIPHKSEDLFNSLTKKGVILDWRRPDVIRVAPTPLYNSFMDVLNFSRLLQTSMEEIYG